MVADDDARVLLLLLAHRRDHDNKDHDVVESDRNSNSHISNFGNFDASAPLQPNHTFPNDQNHPTVILLVR
jgi:hypothetical protein